MQCLHRWQKVLNPELVKGPWTKEVNISNILTHFRPLSIDYLILICYSSVQEDDLVIALVKQHGAQKWSLIASHLKGRIGKQCRER